MHVLSLRPWRALSVGALLLMGLAGCAESPSTPDLTDFGSYPLVSAPPGFYFFPPLAPTPTGAGTFVGGHLAEVAVLLEQADGAGGYSVQVGRFDERTSPRVVVKAAQERYQVSVPARDYFTVRGAAYRFRVLVGAESIATADVPVAIFDFIDRYPDIKMTVAFRLEEGALDRDGDGIPNALDHCPNKYDPTNTPPSPEVCDGIDNDCDGIIDDGNPGSGAACSTGQLGACAAGTTTCNAGHLDCIRTRGPSPEVCDGVDNDCDGQTDEGDPGAGVACTTGEAGVCSPGVTVCARGALTCVHDQGPSAEACDGVDNDCNGAIDNGAAASCPGYVHGNAACTSGHCALGTCASPYLNCDGNESNGCETDGSTSYANCGGCGHTCVGQETCTNGACALVCAAHTANCDGSSLNGCEADLMTSNTSCGVCGYSCVSGMYCSSGVCMPDPGSTPANPSQSCLAILQSGRSHGNGLYWIDPNGGSTADAFQTYCDMTTGGGGWTLVGNFVSSTYSTTLTGGDTSMSFLAPIATVQSIAAVSAQIRYHCQRASNGAVIDVYTSNSNWTTRPYSLGDGCTQGYNWTPNTSSFGVLPDNTYSMRGASGVSCCCRPNHRLATYQIGFYTYDWLIDDLYYAGMDRLCAGSTASFHRIFYR